MKDDAVNEEARGDLAALWPLLRRELMAYARDRRARMLFAVGVAIAAAAAFLFYTYGAASLLRRAGRSGSAGPGLFEFLTGVEIVFVVWCVPHLLVRRTTEERLSGSLTLLHSALHDARRVALVKLAAAMACGGLFACVVAPFYGLVLLLGGVEVIELAVAACIVLSSAALAAAAALRIARAAGSVGGATFTAGAWAAVLTIGLPLAGMLAEAAARQVFGAAVRSGGLPLAAGAIEVLLGLAESLSPLTALLGWREHFAATGEVWLYRKAIFTAAGGVQLPAPFLVLAAVYAAAAAALLRGNKG